MTKKHVQLEEILQPPLTDFADWLKSKKIFPIYVDCEGQSPFWELECAGKKHFIVWDEKNTVSIMIQADFSEESQVRESYLQKIILDNLHYCSRKDGEHCNNCHLPPDVAGIDNIIFGKEVKNLCCGQYISFDNPNAETIEAIKKLLPGSEF